MTYSKVSRSRCSSSFKNQICFVVSYYLHTYICFACVVNVCFATASKKPLDPPASNSIPLPSRGFNDVLRLLRTVGTGGKPPSLQRLQKTKGYPPDFQTILRPCHRGLQPALGDAWRNLGPVDCCLF